MWMASLITCSVVSRIAVTTASGSIGWSTATATAASTLAKCAGTSASRARTISAARSIRGVELHHLTPGAGRFMPET